MPSLVEIAYDDNETNNQICKPNVIKLQLAANANKKTTKAESRSTVALLIPKSHRNNINSNTNNTNNKSKRKTCIIMDFPKVAHELFHEANSIDLDFYEYLWNKSQLKPFIINPFSTIKMESEIKQPRKLSLDLMPNKRENLELSSIFKCLNKRLTNLIFTKRPARQHSCGHKRPTTTIDEITMLLNELLLKIEEEDWLTNGHRPELSTIDCASVVCPMAYENTDQANNHDAIADVITDLLSRLESDQIEAMKALHNQPESTNSEIETNWPSQLIDIDLSTVRQNQMPEHETIVFQSQLESTTTDLADSIRMTNERDQIDQGPSRFNESKTSSSSLSDTEVPISECIEIACNSSTTHNENTATAAKHYEKYISREDASNAEQIDALVKEFTVNNYDDDRTSRLNNNNENESNENNNIIMILNNNNLDINNGEKQIEMKREKLTKIHDDESQYTDTTKTIEPEEESNKGFDCESIESRSLTDDRQAFDVLKSHCETNMATGAIMTPLIDEAKSCRQKIVFGNNDVVFIENCVDDEDEYDKQIRMNKMNSTDIHELIFDDVPVVATTRTTCDQKIRKKPLENLIPIPTVTRVLDNNDDPFIQAALKRFDEFCKKQPTTANTAKAPLTNKPETKADADYLSFIKRRQSRLEDAHAAAVRDSSTSHIVEPMSAIRSDKTDDNESQQISARSPRSTSASSRLAKRFLDNLGTTGQCLVDSTPIANTIQTEVNKTSTTEDCQAIDPLTCDQQRIKSNPDDDPGESHDARIQSTDPKAEQQPKSNQQAKLASLNGICKPNASTKDLVKFLNSTDQDHILPVNLLGGLEDNTKIESKCLDNVQAKTEIKSVVKSTPVSEETKSCPKPLPTTRKDYAANDNTAKRVNIIKLEVINSKKTDTKQPETSHEITHEQDSIQTPVYNRSNLNETIKLTKISAQNRDFETSTPVERVIPVEIIKSTCIKTEQSPRIVNNVDVDDMHTGTDLAKSTSDVSLAANDAASDNGSIVTDEFTYEYVQQKRPNESPRPQSTVVQSYLTSYSGMKSNDSNRTVPEADPVAEKACNNFMSKLMELQKQKDLSQPYTTTNKAAQDPTTTKPSIYNNILPTYQTSTTTPYNTSPFVSYSLASFNDTSPLLNATMMTTRPYVDTIGIKTNMLSASSFRREPNMDEFLYGKDSSTASTDPNKPYVSSIRKRRTLLDTTTTKDSNAKFDSTSEYFGRNGSYLSANSAYGRYGQSLSNSDKYSNLISTSTASSMLNAPAVAYGNTSWASSMFNNNENRDTIQNHRQYTRRQSTTSVVNEKYENPLDRTSVDKVRKKSVDADQANMKSYLGDDLKQTEKPVQQSQQRSKSLCKTIVVDSDSKGPTTTAIGNKVLVNSNNNNQETVFQRLANTMHKVKTNGDKLSSISHSGNHTSSTSPRSSESTSRDGIRSTTFLPSKYHFNKADDLNMKGSMVDTVVKPKDQLTTNFSTTTAYDQANKIDSSYYSRKKDDLPKKYTQQPIRVIHDLPGSPKSGHTKTSSSDESTSSSLSPDKNKNNNVQSRPIFAFGSTVPKSPIRAMPPPANIVSTYLEPSKADCSNNTKAHLFERLSKKADSLKNLVNVNKSGPVDLDAQTCLNTQVNQQLSKNGSNVFERLYKAAFVASHSSNDDTSHTTAPVSPNSDTAKQLKKTMSVSTTSLTQSQQATSTTAPSVIRRISRQSSKPSISKQSSKENHVDNTILTGNTQAGISVFERLSVSGSRSSSKSLSKTNGPVADTEITGSVLHKSKSGPSLLAETKN